MGKLRPLMGSIGAPGAAEKDAVAFVAFLDAQKQVNTSKKIGTQGYCMGGPLVFRTLAAVPNRVGAGGSFHGGGLVSDQPTSPHLLIPKMQARLHVAIAANDDQRQPDAKDKMKEAFCVREGAGWRSRWLPRACTAGACPTCRRKRTTRSTTSPRPKKPGRSSSHLLQDGARVNDTRRRQP